MCPIPDPISAEATPHDDPPPAHTQAIPAACGTDRDGKALHTPTEEKYYASWEIFIFRFNGMVNTYPDIWASHSSRERIFLKGVYNRTYMARHAVT
eukprot:3424792-Pyramimonas_sp.AAC.1